MREIREFEQRAIVETRLDDFGGDSYREGLERLLSAVSSEAKLSQRGKASFDTMVHKALVNRLEVQHWVTKHPEIDKQEITKPLIGLGLPRTGSTAFFHMLSMDPNIRTIRSWEGTRPCPPPIAGEEDNDFRVVDARKAMDAMHRENPRLKTMLPSTATSALECGIVMSYEFKSNFYSAMFHIPSYSNWLVHEADMVPAYQYLKRVLKLLQWRCPPNRWRLKSPPHSQFIRSLDEVFPDANFWVTHRDICKVIPSVADLYYEHDISFSDCVDKQYLGQFNTDFWQTALQRMISFRDCGNDHRFFDVYFDEFQRDPYPSIARLYEFSGEDLSQETRDRIQAWREEMPRGKHGEHRYDAAEYGIDLDKLQHQFRFYNERFGLVG